MDQASTDHIFSVLQDLHARLSALEGKPPPKALSTACLGQEQVARPEPEGFNTSSTKQVLISMDGIVRSLLDSKQFYFNGKQRILEIYGFSQATEDEKNEMLNLIVELLATDHAAKIGKENMRYIVADIGTFYHNKPASEKVRKLLKHAFQCIAAEAEFNHAESFMDKHKIELVGKIRAGLRRMEEKYKK